MITCQHYITSGPCLSDRHSVTLPLHVASHVCKDAAPCQRVQGTVCSTCETRLLTRSDSAQLCTADSQHCSHGCSHEPRFTPAAELSDVNVCRASCLALWRWLSTHPLCSLRARLAPGMRAGSATPLCACTRAMTRSVGTCGTPGGARRQQRWTLSSLQRARLVRRPLLIACGHVAGCTSVGAGPYRRAHMPL